MGGGVKSEKQGALWCRGDRITAKNRKTKAV